MSEQGPERVRLTAELREHDALLSERARAVEGRHR
jgi:hypothetical protein